MTNPVFDNLTCINSFAGDFGIMYGSMVGGSAPASLAFPASNDALMVPFYLNNAVTIKRLWTANGGTASGNIDVGIYSRDSERIVSSGSTAQSGTNGLQFFDVTDFVLGPGKYYMAVAMDNTTGTLFRTNTVVVRLLMLGMAKQASAFPLPASITPAPLTAAYLPLIGAEVSSLL